jgi:hypothetical protein
MIPSDDEYNFTIYRENLSVIILYNSPKADKKATGAKGRKRKKQINDEQVVSGEICQQNVDDIAEFVDVGTTMQTGPVHTICFTDGFSILLQISLRISRKISDV